MYKHTRSHDITNIVRNKVLTLIILTQQQTILLAIRIGIANALE